VDRQCASLFLTPGAPQRDDNLTFVRERLLRGGLAGGAGVAALLDLYGRVLAGRRVPDSESSPVIALLRLSGVVAAAGGGCGCGTASTPTCSIGPG